jgi:hypothetical protein
MVGKERNFFKKCGPIRPHLKNYIIFVVVNGLGYNGRLVKAFKRDPRIRLTFQR